MNFEYEIKTLLSKLKTQDNVNVAAILSDTTGKIYAIGKNEQTEELIKKYPISGLIDDFNKKDKEWCGISIVSTADVARDSIVVNCVTSISPIEVRKNLSAAGLRNVVSLSDLISESGSPLALPWFVYQQREEIHNHMDWWAEFYELLSDDISKNTLLDVLRFRLTANPDYMSNYPIRLRDQYFEDFMEYKNETFVDAGGFDGDTTEEFVVRYPDYKKIFFFEPSAKNLIAAKQRLIGRRDIDFRPLGLSDVEGTLHFNADAGSASAVDKDGKGETISVVALDDELAGESISFIKMDLEGWEMNALRGAASTISTKKPKLAIAVYHAAKDFREVPQYILSLNPDYKVFLRHYTQGWSETVMFFL